MKKKKNGHTPLRTIAESPPLKVTVGFWLLFVERRQQGATAHLLYWIYYFYFHPTGLRLLEEEESRTKFLKRTIQGAKDRGIAKSFNPKSYFKYLKAIKKENGF